MISAFSICITVVDFQLIRIFQKNHCSIPFKNSAKCRQMMETPRGTTTRFGTRLCQLYLLEAMFAMYADGSIMLFLIRCLCYQLFLKLLSTPSAGRGALDDFLSPLRIRLLLTVFLNALPVVSHLPYSALDETPYKWFYNTLHHTKYLTFTPQLDTVGATGQCLLDFLFVIITFLLLSTSVINHGGSCEGIVASLQRPTSSTHWRL